MQWWESAISAVSALFGKGGIIDQLVPDSDKAAELKYALATVIVNARIIQYTLCACLLMFAGALGWQIIMDKPISIVLLVLVLIGYGGNFQFTAQLIGSVVELLEAMAKFGTAIVERVTPAKK